MQEPSTIAVSKADVSLLQALSSLQERRPCLVLYSGADAGRPFDLEPGATVIGRSPDAQLHVDSPGISRRHAELMLAEGAVQVRDLQSSNGTFVNEVAIDGPVPLRDGDLLRLGVLVFRFYERQSLDAALHDRVYRMATIDSGTEVFNRRYLLDVLKREMRLARQQTRPLAVICVDLDHFKSVNDRYGHAAGDTVLKESAGLLLTALPRSGVLGRLGGEEFGIVLPGADLQQAVAVAENGRLAVAGHGFAVVEGQAPHRQTLSAGVAVYRAEMSEPVHLLAVADQRLYASKNGGRNRVSA